MSTAAPVKDGLSGLGLSEPMQEHIRRRFGLPLRDEAALARVSRRFKMPAWAQGFISIHDAMFLYDLVRGIKPERVIEVGVAAGGSTALLLMALAGAGVPLTAGDGRAALQSFELHPYCFFDRARPVGSAVGEMVPELAHGVELHIRGTAATAGKMFASRPVSLAFIDADHRHPAPTADLLHLLPALAPGAWVVLHDIMLPELLAMQGKPGTERGAAVLFERWPFEKIRGGGPTDRGMRVGARNIGAIRLPTDRRVSAEDLRGAIREAWEVEPDAGSRSVLNAGRGAPRTPETVVAMVASHTVSGVSSAMARIAGLTPPHDSWRLLAVGPGADVKAAVGSETAGFGAVSWHATAGVVEQVRMVRDRLRELGARVVSPNFLVHGFVAAALDRHRGRRVAAIWHGSEIGAEDLYERTAPLVDAWRAVSPAIARRIARYTGVPGGVTPMGVEMPGRITPLPITRGRGEPLRLLFAGWLDERTKRVMDLAALADGLAARGVDFRLTVAGRGPASTRLAAAMAEHIVAGRVAMAGPVALEAMDELHRGQDMLVLVSAMEGSPVVVMEAMGHGRPVAVTRGCGGALAAVRDGESGVVVGVGEMGPLADKLAALWAQPARLAAMGTTARAAAERCFDVRRLAVQYDAMVGEALAAPDGPRADEPERIAEVWGRILAALELIGPCSAPELAGLAVEWLADLGVTSAVLHLTPDAAALMGAMGEAACIAGAAGNQSGSWMGWPVTAMEKVKPGTLVLSASTSGDTWPRGVHVLPLVLPGMPTLAARLVLEASEKLRARGCGRLAIYGAGKHTRKVARWLGQVRGLSAIVDDRAGEQSGPGTRLWGLPIVPPDQLAGLGIEGIIVSSDEHERTMLERARGWWTGPIDGLYGELEKAAGAYEVP